MYDAGLVYKILRLSKVEKPLKFYEDIDAFKLFVLDLKGVFGLFLLQKHKNSVKW